MKHRLKRSLTLLLALALAACASGCACGAYLLGSALGEGVSALLDGDGGLSALLDGGGETDAVEIPASLDTGAADPAHPDVTLEEMRYERPDTAAIDTALTALETALSQGADAQTLLSDYADVRARFDTASDMLSLADLLYSFNVTDPTYQEEYEWLYAALNELDLHMTDVTIAILESDTAGAAAYDAWGPEYAEAAYASDKLNIPEIQPLLADEQSLVFDYDALSNSFIYSEAGREWDFDAMAEAYYAGEIDYDEYTRLFDAYGAAFNAEAGEIFTRLLALRAEIAAKLGYGSYAAYGYDLYGRDYTVSDAKALHAAVKERIVPLYLAANEHCLDELDTLSGASFSFGDTLTAFQGTLEAFSPSLLTAYNFMLRNGLCSFTVDGNKIDGSFTTYVAQYGAPYLFTQWKGGSQDVRTLIHEFGHYANFYLNPETGWNSGGALDLAEVDSQGLELLMTDSYASLFGKRASAAEKEALIDAMYAVITGCMEDEFQQLAYENPTMTLGELNAVYARLAEEYGMAELYGYTGTEWALVPHTFQTPMYYISYATSMLLALELYTLDQTDTEAARSAYMAILNRAPYAAFRTLAEQNGLTDPISASNVRDIAGALQKKLLGKSK